MHVGDFSQISYSILLWETEHYCNFFAANNVVVCFHLISRIIISEVDISKTECVLGLLPILQFPSAHNNTSTRTNKHACTHVRTHARWQARTHTHTHTHTHAHTHTHTHTPLDLWRPIAVGDDSHHVLQKLLCREMSFCRRKRRPHGQTKSLAAAG